MKKSLPTNRLFEKYPFSKPLLDIGGRVASFSTPAYLEFKEFLGLDATLLPHETVTLLNTIAEIDNDILNLLGCPFRRVYLKPPASFHLRVEQNGSFTDEWGVRYVPRCHLNERTGHPLASATSIDDIENYPWPDPNDISRIEGLDEKIEKLKEIKDVIICAGHVSAGIFQDCWNMRGMQQFFEDLVINKDFAEVLLDKVTEIHIAFWDLFLSRVGQWVDIVETADDLGSQAGLLISPKMYRTYIKPRHTRLNQAIRAKTNARIFFHSCGAVMPLIGDLIEIGVQILNPIQPIEGLMDPEELINRYGENLIFHGGLDVQRLLLHGTPQEVRRVVTRYYETFGVDRFIMAPTNSIQPGTPPENILVAYETANQLMR